ncbi:hypothetical protein IMZ68_01210 [Candidatus Bathyarchaeota archaeon]|nr:hypothetical protein [Candidatus Bathyarchaeota archaeon]
MGPYVVGFDTMGYYVPTTMLWLSGGVNLWSFIATAPLLYTLTAGFTFAGASLIWVLKVLPAVLLGFLGLSMYIYARRGLGWSPKKSIIPALVGTLYFVALRVSWDAFREELALIFFFVVLTLLVARSGASDKFSWKRFVAFSLALAAVMLSNQFVAVLMLGVVLFTVIYKLVRESRVDAARLVLFSLPAVLLFFTMFYLSPAVPEYRLIFGFPTTPDGWLALFGYSSYPAMLISEAGFILYCFVPLLPLALLSVRRFKSFQMRCWVVLVLAAAFIPIVSPSDMRLLMLLTYPLAFYVTEGLSRLKMVNWKRFRVTLLRVGMIYLVVMTAVLSVGFMTLPPNNPFPYFKAGQINGYIYQIPTSMLQNTISISDCKDTVNALQWLKGNMTGNAVLLTHRVFYGWALSTFNSQQLLMYEYDNPVNAAATATREGYNQIYLIWWINGQGWEGQPTVSSTFHEIYQSGDIAIYLYAPNSNNVT